MSNTRTAAASAVLALFMLSAAPMPQVLGPSPAAAQSADQLLADQTPLSSMDDKALSARIKGLRELMKSGSLSKAQKQDARNKIKEAQVELKARNAAGKQAPANQQTQSQQTQQTQQTQQGPSSSPELLAIINDKRPLDQLSDAELHARIKAGVDARKAGNLSRADKQAINRFVPQARAELKKRQTTKQGTKAQPQTTDDAQAMQPKMDKGEARTIVADKRDAKSLSTPELRKRVNETRQLLGDKQLQQDMRKQLRDVLVQDRQELRSRIAVENNSNASVDNTTTFKNSSKNVVNNQTTIINNNTTVTQIVQRQTPSDKLDESDLNRRIRLLERARRENRLQGQELQIAGQIIINDRLALRARLVADRGRRERYIREHRNSFKLGINVVVAPRLDIYAAEADPMQVQQQLVAAPRWKPRRAYSFDEIVRDDNVRRAMPGVEIDTVTFDTGSAVLAPEMIDQLENVATVIEKVLAVRPNEIFLIEGHTDAVGSAESNLVLSQARAESVKAALTEYFAIDPKNLRTIGLGERFLKIPTDGPEQENRRVTVRRITPMLTGEVN